MEEQADQTEAIAIIVEKGPLVLSLSKHRRTAEQRNRTYAKALRQAQGERSF